MSDKSVKFCEIIQGFCKTLADFATYVLEPTIVAKRILHEHKNYRKRFSEYVDNIDKFNHLMLGVTENIKAIVISLNMLFIEKTEETLVIFMSKIHIFLMQIKDEDILQNLVILRESMDTSIDKHIKLNEKINNITGIVFTICKVTIGITTFFVPQLEPVTIVIDGIDQVCRTMLTKTIASIEESKIDFKKIIEAIISVSLKAETIEAIGLDTAKSCMIDKDSKIVLTQIDTISNDYNRLVREILELKNVIEQYKEKKNHFAGKFCFRLYALNPFC